MQKMESNLLSSLSLEMRDFLASIDQFSSDYNDYISKSAFKVSANLLEEDIQIRNLQLIYLHLHEENERLKNYIEEIQFNTSESHSVTFGPPPIKASSEYPKFQTFSGYSQTAE